MTNDEVYKRITRYLDGASTSPILVDVPTCGEKDKILKHFAINGIEILTAAAFAPSDELPQWDTLKHCLSTKQENSILVGIGDFLKLEGKQIIDRELRQLLEIVGVSKTIIVTVGCAKWIKQNDPRLKSSGKITILDGEEQPLKSLLFVKPGLMDLALRIEGINNLPKQFNFPGSEVTVVTEHVYSDYPNSLYDIKEFGSKYEVIVAAWTELNVISEDFGTPEQWDSLSETLSKWGSLENSLSGFGGKKGLCQVFSRFEELDEYDKWFYLLSLKIFGAENNKYLTKAARESNSVAEFVQHIYEDILEIEPNSKSFPTSYAERRPLLPHLAQYPDVTEKFCKLIWSKEKNALSYLSDASTKEKECIIAYLGKYGKAMGRKNVMSRLMEVYPALYHYLSDYPYDNSLLDKYFREYKYNKAINHISDEMRDMVEEQAIKREFNTILQPRSLVVDNIEASGAVLYFMDAMGAEYLSYLQTSFFQ